MPRKSKEEVTKKNTQKPKKNSLKVSKSTNTIKSKSIKKDLDNSKIIGSNSSLKKSPSKKKTNLKKSDISSYMEYYDLPYKYNKTVVKILSQTPKNIFVYWEISDTDKENYIKKYGKDFFNNTFPVLIVNNKTKNYTFEITINDFANSWYFSVADEKCEYSVELGRRPVNNNVNINNNYLYITSSNNIEAPNDHILLDKQQNIVYFKNTKTNKIKSKNTAYLQSITYLNRIYNIYDIYKKIYKDEDLFNINNPTSNIKDKENL